MRWLAGHTKDVRAVAYTPDGTALLTVSEGDEPELLSYPLPDRPAAPSPSPSIVPSPSPSPSTVLAPSGSPAVAAPARAAAAAGRGGVPAGALFTAVLLVVAGGTLGLFLVRRSRRKRR